MTAKEKSKPDGTLQDQELREQIFKLGNLLGKGDRTISGIVTFSSSDVAFMQMAYCRIGSMLADRIVPVRIVKMEGEGE